LDMDTFFLKKFALHFLELYALVGSLPCYQFFAHYKIWIFLVSLSLPVQMEIDYCV
jgi:hypothetical protein